MFEEIPKIDFTVTENGITVYRDSIIFSDMNELRNTSHAERIALFEQRYQAHLAYIQAAKNNPIEEEPEEI